MDIKFIQFYLLCKYNKSIESYFFVSKSTVSNWRKRGIPIKYLNIFKSIEKSNDIHILFEKIYPKV
jgi:hypothetical protein